jgi:putative phage-type endonuclease
MKIYQTLEQGTKEWHVVRLGKLTASKASAIATNGKGLQTLVFEKVEELLTREFKETFKSKEMERGNELEPKARNAYELETGNIVQEVGFIEQDQYSGCSPDGLVSDDGLVEIKCPNFRTYFEYMESGKINPTYYAQMQMQMLISDRKYCDYVVYHPDFKKNPIIIKRVERDEAKIAKIKVGLAQGIAEIKSILEKIK